MTPRAIAVAGCGPCGLAAALLLARDGHHVTLFERFEAPRPIGSGLMLQPTGMAVLAELGLADAARASGAAITHLIGKTGGGHAGRARTVLDVSYAALKQPGTCGIGIHRAALFGLLHDAVRARRIPIETGHTIASAPADGAGRYLAFADGTVAGPFDLVVDALGTRTPLAPPTGRDLGYGALWATLDWPSQGFDPAALEQRYRAASRMAGVLPIGVPPEHDRPQVAFFWSLRADRLDAWRTAGLAAWKAEAVALWPATAPLLDAITDPAQLVFARYAHRTLRRPAEPALVHIGDAWHSASPQLGQGANMALLDAYALAMGLRAESGLAAGLDHAVRLRRRHVHLYQALTALFTPVYQSDSRLLPFARDWLVAPLSKVPLAMAVQARMVSGLIGNPLEPLALLPGQDPTLGRVPDAIA
jgi:2-polyprenyl-6-methoxyphenol hydroxylase-like FAD-dependent oxidoreductase